MTAEEVSEQSGADSDDECEWCAEDDAKDDENLRARWE